MLAADDLALAVPGDLSIVGFDDIPAAALADPALTTVRQPLAAKGRTAAEFTLRLLNGDHGPSPIDLPTELVVRASTAPPKAGAPTGDSPTPTQHKQQGPRRARDGSALTRASFRGVLRSAVGRENGCARLDVPAMVTRAWCCLRW